MPQSSKRTAAQNNGALAALVLFTGTLLGGASANVALAAETRSIAFPTDPQQATLSDSFGDARSGHSHEGDDIIGKKMLPLYAAVDGFVRDVEIPESNWGYAIVLEDADDWTYHYIHVNNDTPGTDDGNGGTANAYASGIQRGARVTKGQLVGWMGDSGNAETVGAHLHFEIRKPDRTPIDPYPSLVAALGGTPVPNSPGGASTGTSGGAVQGSSYSAIEAREGSPDISTDKSLAITGATPCAPGARIKIASSTAVYYCGNDGRRYVFPNSGVHDSWYFGFNGVQTISDAAMADVRIGGNVTYRPGAKMVKITTDPKVYAVEKGGVLRWVTTSALAATLYGADWVKKVDDVPDTFFADYRIGAPVTSTR